jgi:hypothetical protein
MESTLLPEDLRSRFPPLHSQDDELLPIVYARYFQLGSLTEWYVIEGQVEGKDFLFFGYVLGPNRFQRFRLSELEAARNAEGQPVQRDEAFVPGPFTDVVPAPDL